MSGRRMPRTIAQTKTAITPLPCGGSVVEPVGQEGDAERVERPLVGRHRAFEVAPAGQDTEAR